MTDDKILEMAKQFTADVSTHESLIAFARLIAERQREECAVIAEDWDSDSADPRDVATAIRNSGGAA
jgi:hypothetical protein